MYTNAIPLVQGLAFDPNRPAANPLETVGNAYGMWYGAMQYDPSGALFRSTVQNAIWSGAVGAGVGYLLPGFTVKEGVKWGALLGAAQTVFFYMTSRSEP